MYACTYIVYVQYTIVLCTMLATISNTNYVYVYKQLCSYNYNSYTQDDSNSTMLATCSTNTA